MNDINYILYIIGFVLSSRYVYGKLRNKPDKKALKESKTKLIKHLNNVSMVEVSNNVDKLNNDINKLNYYVLCDDRSSIPTWSADTSYNIGDMFTMNGKLYKAEVYDQRNKAEKRFYDKFNESELEFFEKISEEEVIPLDKIMKILGYKS